MSQKDRNWKFYLRIAGIVAAVVAVITLFLFNWYKSRVSLFGLVDLFIPSILLWLLLLFAGCIIGYLFRAWEERRKRAPKK